MKRPAMSCAATIDSQRRLSVTEVEHPAPGPGEVCVDVAYCGLCGSDLHLLFDVPTPMAGHILGHEFSGVVSGVADDVSEWAVGDRVVVLPIDPCGLCSACRRDDGMSVCTAGLFAGPGLGRPGGLAESVNVPARMLHAIPGHLSLRDAALTEPLAVAVRGVAHAQVEPGDVVVVAGAGPIGLLTVEALHSRGIDDVVVIEPNPARRRQAGEFGAVVTAPEDAALAVGRMSAPPQAVIDCSGHPSVAQRAVDLLDYGGRLVIVGLPAAPAEISLLSLALKEIEIVGSTAYSRRDFLESLYALAAGRINAGALITSVVTIADADAKIHELHTGTSDDIKVLVAHSTQGDAADVDLIIK